VILGRLDTEPLDKVQEYAFTHALLIYVWNRARGAYHRRSRGFAVLLPQLLQLRLQGKRRALSPQIRLTAIPVDSDSSKSRFSIAEANEPADLGEFLLQTRLPAVKRRHVQDRAFRIALPWPLPTVACRR